MDTETNQVNLDRLMNNFTQTSRNTIQPIQGKILSHIEDKLV